MKEKVNDLKTLPAENKFDEANDQMTRQKPQALNMPIFEKESASSIRSNSASSSDGWLKDLCSL